MPGSYLYCTFPTDLMSKILTGFCILHYQRVARAKSRNSCCVPCQREIGELVCRIQSGDFYPASLPRYCPAHLEAGLQGSRLGCFRDSFSSRLLQVGCHLPFYSSRAPSSAILGVVHSRTGSHYFLFQFRVMLLSVRHKDKNKHTVSPMQIQNICHVSFSTGFFSTYGI
jgi:hypothetical protein